MLKQIKTIYKNIFNYFRTDFLFILIVLLAIATNIVHRIVNSETDISQYLAYYESTRPLYESEFPFIFFENMKAMFQTVYMGFVPFFLGSIFHLFFAADSLVAMFRFVLAEFPLGTVLVGTLPHGIFEFPAMIFSVILGAIISKEITLFLLSLVTRKKFDNPESVLHRHKLNETAVFLPESIVFVVIPLVFLGAFVESFITEWIFEMIF